MRPFQLGLAATALAMLLSACDAGTDIRSVPSGNGGGGGGGGGSATPTPSATATPTGGGAGTPTATPNGGTPSPTASAATPTSTPSGVMPTSTPSGVTPTSTPAGNGTPGPLTISPDPINFGLTSVLGSTATATISQINYSGPFTLPTNSTVCTSGLTSIPVTASISGSQLTVTLGLLGVTGTCTITVDGAPGTSGTEAVNLTIPIGTPANPGPLTFSIDPIDFNVLNAVAGGSQTVTVSETNYTGSFTLPSNPISCPFDLVGLTGINASIANGNQLTVATGALNASLLGSCSVTVQDSAMRTGAETVNFELL